MVGPSTVFMGDAAHSVLPNMGQGVNCGLQDAQVFSQVLHCAEWVPSSSQVLCYGQILRCCKGLADHVCNERSRGRAVHDPPNLGDSQQWSALSEHTVCPGRPAACLCIACTQSRPPALSTAKNLVFSLA